MRKLLVLIGFVCVLFGADTPLESLYKNKFNGATVFDRYAQYFVDFRAGGDKTIIEQIILSDDDYLRYYESIVKGLYYYYHGDKRVALQMFDTVYDRAFDMLSNTFEGVMLQNVFLKEGITNKLNIVSNNYCNHISQEIDQIGCKANAIVILGMQDNKQYGVELIRLNKANTKLANEIEDYLENILQK